MRTVDRAGGRRTAARRRTPARARRALLGLLLAFGAATARAEGEASFARLANPLNLAGTQLAPLEHAFVAAHPTLRVAVARDPYPPFVEVRDGVVWGQAIQFLQSVAAATGFELELVLLDTWADVRAALERREADLTPAATPVPDLERYLHFTVGIAPNPAGLVGRTGDGRFARDPALEGMRVGVVAGFAAESFLGDQFPLAVPVPLPSAGEALRRLADGELDYYYGDLPELFFEPDDDLVEALEIKQRVYYASGWTHLAVRSDWPMVVRLFDRFARGQQRERLDPLLADEIDHRLDAGTIELSLSPEEVRYVSRLEVLKVGSVAGVPLLNDVDAAGNHVGIASEFTAYLAYQLGRSVENHSYPSVETMLAGLEDGEIDLIPYFAITEERRRTLAFSAPYLTMPWVAFGRVDDTLFWDLGSLAGRRLAVRRKHPLLPVLHRDYPFIELVMTDTAGEAVDAVLAGEADAAVETKLYVNREVQRNAGRLRVLGDVTDDRGEFAFAVRPDERVMAGVVDKALATMSPELIERVVRRWVAIDFEPERRLRNLLNVLVPTLGAITLSLFAALYWNRRVAAENRRRLAAERRLVDMTEGLRTGVFQFVHRRGEAIRMVFANAVTRRMARVAPDGDDRDMNFFAHIDPEDREPVRERLRHCLASGEHFRESFRFDFPDGEKGWILADAQCRTERDGARTWNGYLFDLTAERTMSEELNALLSARNEFVSMASHELRTPVQNLALSLGSVDPADVTGPAIERIELARSAARDLEELVSDIVELTGMNHHSPTLADEPFDLHALVRGVCRTFSARAAQRGLDYTVVVDASLPRRVRGDALRLKQILYNVVGNALKYTDAGEVRVVATAPGGGGGGGTERVRIAVSDTGIGIPAASLPKIFEPFATIGPSSRRSSGLGLTLCDRLAALMGGRIDVASVEGEGSTFTIELPLGSGGPASAAPRPAPRPAASRRVPPASRTILVVDDDPRVSELVASLLEAEGWETRRADSGDEALARLAADPCLAVLTDQRMPGTSGTELARRVRELHGEASPVLILMTGGMAREEAASSVDVFDAVLFKPVKTGDILRTLEDCLGDRPDAVPGTLSAPRPAPPGGPADPDGRTPPAPRTRPDTPRRRSPAT